MNNGIDLTTLRVVVTAADLGSISAASNRLDLAVAAASARITGLEDALGFRIFERSPRGVHLTPDGHMLVQRGRTVLNDADRFASDLHDYARGLRGHVRVLANSSALLEVLPARIEAFTRQYPLIQIGLDECGSPDIPIALLEGRADVGIVDLPIAPLGLTLTDFFEDTLVLLVPKNHRLAQHDRLPLCDALDEEFISLTDTTALAHRLTASAASVGKTIRIRMRMRGFDAVTRMVAAGLGVCVLPLEAVAPQLATLPLKVVALSDPWARRTHRIATRSDVQLSPAARTLIAALTQ